MNMNDLIREIERLEYVIASVSIDRGRGKNPQGLDVPYMERAVVLLRAYRDISARGADMDAAMATIPATTFGNLAETDPFISLIRDELLDPETPPRPDLSPDLEQRITIRYWRTGRDAHDWLFAATLQDWLDLTDRVEPSEVEHKDCDPDKFDEILDFPEGSEDGRDSPYIVICY